MNGVREHSEDDWKPDGLAREGRRGRVIARAHRHDDDLTVILGPNSTRWTDALASETRAQLGGCMNAMEVAIGLNIASVTIASMVGALGPAYCRRAIEAEPQLLSRAIVDHFRMRAALALVAKGGRERLEPAIQGAEVDFPRLSDVADPAGDFIALSLIEARWLVPSKFDGPIRPDLPAEIYADLAWSVAALLVQACERQLGSFSREATDSIGAAAQQAIARHDEGVGPIALAIRCARNVPADQRRQIASLALGERRLLLFAALSAEELQISVGAALSAMLNDIPDGRAALFRVMSVDSNLALKTLQALAPIDGRELDDERIANFIESCRGQSVEQARAIIDRMAGVEPLAARLAMIDRVRP